MKLDEVIGKEDADFIRVTVKAVHDKKPAAQMIHFVHYLLDGWLVLLPCGDKIALWSGRRWVNKSRGSVISVQTDGKEVDVWSENYGWL